ncbi:glycosyl hydrolase family 95 catalytic domain-containing protein [Rhodopirellula sp. SWK7]|uniref:glycoside hydrolase family 95 protein n=1 Tax=Rhodopirellula sp. SWK7 TaxID=595460 RepID=UPI0002BF1F7F|nr:glycoside hydrolase family 95 protein [Rhodopirellula sp. SWK7]EMI45533.1 glycoside hydrolase family 95 [Rhodopirellula sp. SWK7]
MNKGAASTRMPRWMAAVCLIAIVVGTHAGDVGGADVPVKKDARANTLWYRHPANTWMTEALPIGNGPMGVMLFGHTDLERIQFNEISLWGGRRLASKEYAENDDMGSYQAFGDLFVQLGHDPEKVTKYRRELDIQRAVHRVTYEYEGVRYEQLAFASHPAGVIVVHFAANKPAAYSGRIWLTDMHNAPITASANRLAAVGRLKNGFEYEAQVQALTQGGKLSITENDSVPENQWEIELPATCLSFDKSDSVTLFLSAGTNFEQDFAKEWLGEHPHAAVTQRVDSAASRSVDVLLAEHVSDYQSLFGRVSIDLGMPDSAQIEKSTKERLEDYTRNKVADPDLEALFCQFGRYLLISCSRPGSLPANLQGVWNDSNRPAWAGDYHSNINVEMNYWPAETSNLAECHVPFIDYVSSLRDVCAQKTQMRYGDVRGWTIQTMNNACGVSSWKWNPPGSAWYAQHLWEHYAFGRDIDYLRETAYPILKEICLFWQDHLKRRPDGTLVTPDGWSPEQYKYEPEEGVTYDQEIVYDLFTNVIEAADALGDDKEFRDEIAAMRDDLLKPAIGSWGQLKEWEIERDDPEDKHRHVSHLFALFPGRQISMAETPDLAEAARVSLNARGDASTGWSRAWKINFWARLGNGDRAHRLLRSLLNLVAETKTIYGQSGGGVYSNMLCSHPPFQIDGNLGATAGYCEMLLQSHAGQIQLLPALPSAWPTGSAKGLCARGGFEVDLTWKDGQLTSAVIRSKSGQPCRVTYQGKAWESDTTTEATYRLDQNLNPQESEKDS